MEFDFGTLLYIVLGIIYFIFTGANRKKKNTPVPPTPQKKKRTETRKAEAPSHRPTFEELLEEFTTGKKPETELIPEVAVKPVAPESNPIKERPSNKQITRLEHFEDYETDNGSQGKTDYREMFRDLDAAKKAFIASEIFKRKY